ncbi:hypothetical protein [Vibrio parahaemolyticus]|uniref:hypothetical protein n=1 Tax=Vibrio parahaemolyticus TaxID=670 RepID=UPI001F2625FF|nr:hypothetical protein [Vibrio parahaemolyticus]UJX32983.1 hypothetical protein JHS79_26535 [Vibrio parahaemolyticus]
MSLEQQVAALVESTNQLTKIVNDKQSEIDAKVNEALQASIGTVNHGVSRIGQGHDFETLTEALNYYGTKDIKYRDGNRQLITLELQSGFVMSEQIFVYEGKKLDFLRITSVDPVVYIDHVALNRTFWGRKCLIGVADGGAAPRVETLFAFHSDTGEEVIDGLYAKGPAATAYIVQNCGIKNAPGNGLTVLGGAIVGASSADFSGAKEHGLLAVEGGIVSAPAANFSGAGRSAACLSNSTASLNRANLTNAGERGLFAYHGSVVSAEGADTSNSTLECVYAYQYSIVNFRQGFANNAGTQGIFASEGAMINAHAAEANDATSIAIHASLNAKINAANAIAKNAGRHGCVADFGSGINAHAADFTGAQMGGVLSEAGSIVNATDAKAQQGETTAATDIEVKRGSIISAHAALGGTNVTPNTLVSDGIIFA